MSDEFALHLSLGGRRHSRAAFAACLQCRQAAFTIGVALLQGRNALLDRLDVERRLAVSLEGDKGCNKKCHHQFVNIH